jgi:hypothetical protein
MVGAADFAIKSTAGDGWHPAIKLAGNQPTEIITGYGILKTTEAIAPILLQRRHTQSTAFIWAISLDGAPVSLQVSDVKDREEKTFPQAEAVLVQVGLSGRSWSLLVNPQRRLVTAILPDRNSWRTDSSFSVRHQ